MEQTLAPTTASWEVLLVLLVWWRIRSGSLNDDNSLSSDNAPDTCLSIPTSISISTFSSSLSPICLSLSLKQSHFISFLCGNSKIVVVVDVESWKVCWIRQIWKLWDFLFIYFLYTQTKNVSSVLSFFGVRLQIFVSKKLKLGF